MRILKNKNLHTVNGLQEIANENSNLKYLKGTKTGREEL